MLRRCVARSSVRCEGCATVRSRSGSPAKLKQAKGRKGRLLDFSSCVMFFYRTRAGSKFGKRQARAPLSLHNSQAASRMSWDSAGVWANPWSAQSSVFRHHPVSSGYLEHAQRPLQFVHYAVTTAEEE